MKDWENAIATRRREAKCQTSSAELNSWLDDKSTELVQTSMKNESHNPITVSEGFTDPSASDEGP